MDGNPGATRAVHNFDEDLAFSEQASCEPFWDAIYRKAFPDLLSHMLCSGKSKAQELGIDRLILLSNGFTLKVEEKKRRKAYPDIAFEHTANDRTKAPGWIEKDLAINYLAYAFLPIKTAYLFDWQMLKRAWREFGAVWKRDYPEIIAQNPNYKTISVAVPISTVQSAVRNARIIKI